MICQLRLLLVGKTVFRTYDLLLKASLLLKATLATLYCSMSRNSAILLVDVIRRNENWPYSEHQVKDFFLPYHSFEVLVVPWPHGEVCLAHTSMELDPSQR